MVLSEIRGIHYLAPENQILVPPNFGLLQNEIPNLHHLNSLLNHLPNFHFHSSANQFVPPPPSPTPSSCFTTSTTNSTSDETDEYHNPSIIDERKQRRMISNRESARRSRMRKQKHLDELWSQVLRLRTENHKLIDKLNHVSESQDKVLQENARLKEEASDLRQLLAELQIGTSFTSTALRDFDEDPCNTSQLTAESPNQQSLINSVDMLLKNEAI